MKTTNKTNVQYFGSAKLKNLLHNNITNMDFFTEYKLLQRMCMPQTLFETRLKILKALEQSLRYQWQINNAGSRCY